MLDGSRLRNRYPGVTFRDAKHVFIEAAVRIEPGAVIEAFIVLSGQTTISADTHIRSHTVIADSSIGPKCVIGPFAHINRSALGESVHAHHHCYLGDAVVGNDVNIGAFVVTANYDGREKQRTLIRDHAFIGVGAVLVAPVTISESAAVAAGTIVTDNVPPEALAIRRVREQINILGRIKRTNAGWTGLKKRLT